MDSGAAEMVVVAMAAVLESEAEPPRWTMAPDTVPPIVTVSVVAWEVTAKLWSAAVSA